MTKPWEKKKVQNPMCPSVLSLMNGDEEGELSLLMEMRRGDCVHSVFICFFVCFPHGSGHFCLLQEVRPKEINSFTRSAQFCRMKF